MQAASAAMPADPQPRGGDAARTSSLRQRSAVSWRGYPVVNVPEPALAPDRHPVADEPRAPVAGSSHSVAAAVAQVLAARAAAHAPEV